MWHIWPELLSEKGNKLFKSGDYQTAIEYYQRALIMDPDFVQVYVNLGNALTHIGELEKAAENYRNALLLKPRQWDVTIDLANIYLRLGETEKAIDCFDTVLSVSLASVKLLPKACSGMALALQQTSNEELANEFLNASHLMNKLSERQSFRPVAELRSDFA